MQKLVKGGEHMSDQQCDKVPAALRPLMTDCWRFEPAKRPSMGAIKQRLKNAYGELRGAGSSGSTKNDSTTVNTAST